MNNIIRRYIQRGTESLQNTVGALQTAVVPEENGVPAKVDNRLRVMMGQDFPLLPEGQDWEMNIRRNYFAIKGLGTALAALSESVTARFAELGPAVALALSTAQAAQADVEANELVDIAQAAELHAVEAKAVAAQTKADAAQALASGNTVAISAAQTKADAAQAKAEAAQAQATAAIAAAAAAQAQATAASTATTALAGRIRTKRVATPAMAIGGTATMNVVWETPFPDNLYTMSAPALVSGSLLGLAATVTAHSPTGCTVQIKNTLGLVLLAGAGTLELNAIHD